RGVACTTLCAHCNTNFENSWHVVFGCEQVLNVWNSSNIWNNIFDQVLQAEDIVSLIFNLLETLPIEIAIKFVLVLWCIWTRRNDKI
ncbi:hypothetical protein glysoja_007891, partial [Glycine soja]